MKGQAIHQLKKIQITFYKGLLSSINKETPNFKNKKPVLSEKGQKISKYFTEEDMQMKYKHIERYSILLVGKCKLKPQ